MSETAVLIFPHQLFKKIPQEYTTCQVYLIEEYLFFKQYHFHKQKLAFHRATMKAYCAYLQQLGVKVNYVDSKDRLSDVRKLLPVLSKRGVKKIIFTDPVDDWLSKRIKSRVQFLAFDYDELESPLFLNSRDELSPFFKPTKKKYFQTSFYKDQRKRRSILIDLEGNPEGGQWTYDVENRKKYPAKKFPPMIRFPDMNKFHKEAKHYVETHFSNAPGSLDQYPLYPIDFEESKAWFQQFLEFRFLEFGPYEDAIVSHESILNHSVLTPMMNVGLLEPEYVIEELIAFAKASNIPINSTEGFVRQVIGWREFIRGFYECRGAYSRTKNYWEFERKIPSSFYDGTTGIPPIDQTIQKVLQTGYCHHIERLMILGNFMLLCEFDPDEVYRWFMELFIDAYDWVMVPNVYGMSQFADGGLMATKPYISGSNYIRKMSNYSKGPWQEIWDALFWRFMDRQRDFFSGNPRLKMLLSTYDRMEDDRKINIAQISKSYLSELDNLSQS